MDFEFREIVGVKARDDFSLECEMENGEVYKYDMSFINEKDGTLMLELRNVSLFKQVWLEYGALEWPNGFGIHGDTVVRDGTLIYKKSL